MRRLVVLTGAIVFFDTLFFTALTPLLPHYADSLGLGKAGAGVLAAAYPAGCLFGAIPSGMVASRLGVKPTLIVGLSIVAGCIVLFGLATSPWELDTARFAQGFASAFSWTGALAWLVAGTPASRRGTTIGGAFAAATGGALFGPVLGGMASVAGVRWTFVAVGIASLALVAWAAVTPALAPERPQPLSALLRALRNRTVLLGCWFVVLPALLFGTLGVLAPLRLAHLGLGALAISAAFLAAASTETVNNLIIGRASDRHGPLLPLKLGLGGSAIVAALLPWPANGVVLALLVVMAGLAFGTFFTPGLTILSHACESLGLDHGYTFALVTLAWAPGQTAGAAGSGALAHATSDQVPYLLLAGVCALTLAAVWRARTSTASTGPSVEASSTPSRPTTVAD
jgi:MFS family permease